MNFIIRAYRHFIDSLRLRIYHFIQRIRDKEPISDFSPDQISPTFCIMPWFNLATETNGKCKICCVVMTDKYIQKDCGSDFLIQEDRIEDIWNSEYLKDIRQRMLTGKEVADCSYCTRQEAAGVTSPRWQFSKRWTTKALLRSVDKSKNSNGAINTLPTSIEPRPGITCNIKCNMCWSMSSSKIYAERKAWLSQDHLNPVPEFLKEFWINEVAQAEASDFKWAESPTYLNNLRKTIPNLRRLYFTGGEPVLIPSNIRVLEQLVALGKTDVLVSFTTNLTKIDEKLISLLKHFSRVEITGSIDGFGRGTEYIRYPSQWKDVSSNLLKLHALPNVSVSIMSVAQISNPLSLVELYEWVIEVTGKSQIQVMPTELQTPEHLQLSLAPESIKELAIKRIDNILTTKELFKMNRPFLLDLKTHLTKTHPDAKILRQQFIDYTRFIDRARGTNFFDAFPEFIDTELDFRYRPLALNNSQSPITPTQY